MNYVSFLLIMYQNIMPVSVGEWGLSASLSASIPTLMYARTKRMREEKTNKTRTRDECVSSVHVVGPNRTLNLTHASGFTNVIKINAIGLVVNFILIRGIAHNFTVATAAPHTQVTSIVMVSQSSSISTRSSDLFLSQ